MPTLQKVGKNEEIRGRTGLPPSLLATGNPLRRMMGKSFGSTFLTFEPVMLCSSSLPDPSTTTNFATIKPKSQGILPCVQTIVLRKGACNFVGASKNWHLHSTAQPQSAVLLENEEERQSWDACRQAVSSFNFSVDEADVILKKAFGWVRSPYWGEERPEEVPKVDLVNEMLDYLRNLGLSDDDIFKLLKKFPEVLGCSLEDELKVNVGTLDKVWGIEGKSLRNLLLRNPKVLGYNVDCKGDCMAKCTRCWVRF